VDVRVGHLVAGDHDADPLGGERRPLREADDPGDLEQVGDELGVTVDPVVELGDRDDQRVAASERVDRHEHDAPVVAPDERAGDLAVDDPSEDRGHGRTIGLGGGTPHVQSRP
jgi:hypothetical protein